MVTMRLLTLILCLCCSSVWADYPTEVEWQNANHSRYVQDADHVEVRLWDDSRCDYVSPTHAIEIDWATSKAYEAVGQAMYYSIVLEKKPGIILLVKEGEKDSSQKYIYRCQTVCAKLDIKLWIELVKEN